MYIVKKSRAVFWRRGKNHSNKWIKHSCVTKVLSKPERRTTLRGYYDKSKHWAWKIAVAAAAWFIAFLSLPLAALNCNNVCVLYCDTTRRGFLQYSGCVLTQRERDSWKGARKEGYYPRVCFCVSLAPLKKRLRWNEVDFQSFLMFSAGSSRTRMS